MSSMLFQNNLVLALAAKLGKNKVPGNRSLYTVAYPKSRGKLFHANLDLKENTEEGDSRIENFWNSPEYENL